MPVLVPRSDDVLQGGDVEAVRQQLHLGKINLLGHSYGGVLAQAYYQIAKAGKAWEQGAA